MEVKVHFWIIEKTSNARKPWRVVSGTANPGAAVFFRNTQVRPTDYRIIIGSKKREWIDNWLKEHPEGKEI